MPESEMWSEKCKARMYSDVDEYNNTAVTYKSFVIVPNKEASFCESFSSLHNSALFKSFRSLHFPPEYTHCLHKDVI